MYYIKRDEIFTEEQYESIKNDIETSIKDLEDDKKYYSECITVLKQAEIEKKKEWFDFLIKVVIIDHNKESSLVDTGYIKQDSRTLTEEDFNSMTRSLERNKEKLELMNKYKDSDNLYEIQYIKGYIENLENEINLYVQIALYEDYAKYHSIRLSNFRLLILTDEEFNQFANNIKNEINKLNSDNSYIEIFPSIRNMQCALVTNLKNTLKDNFKCCIKINDKYYDEDMVPIIDAYTIITYDEFMLNKNNDTEETVKYGKDDKPKQEVFEYNIDSYNQSTADDIILYMRKLIDDGYHIDSFTHIDNGMFNKLIVVASK